jgi:hypothetical protein
MLFESAGVNASYAPTSISVFEDAQFSGGSKNEYNSDFPMKEQNELLNQLCSQSAM